jgi:hypothetical protein
MLLFIFLFLFYCKKEDDSPTSPQPVEADYIPYNVGNTWTYQAEPTEQGEANYNATLTVIDKVTINNVETAVVKEQSDKNPQDFSLIYYETTENSLLMHKIDDFEFQTPATWLKLPFVKNDTWQVFNYVGDAMSIPLIGAGLGLDSTYAGLTVDLTLSGETIGKEKVTAANQDFEEAFRIDFNFEAKISIIGFSGKLASFWFVPKVGIVRIAFYDLNLTITEIRTLTSYTLN